MARLVDIGRSTRGSGFDTVSYPTFADLREGAADVFSGVYAMRLGPEPMSLGTAEGGQRIWAEQVSGGYFDVLGVVPALGTVFHAAEERPDVPLRKVVLRHAFWRRQFSADPAVVGRPIVLNGDEFTIARVAPERFEGTTVLTPDLWVPLTAFARGMPRPLSACTASWRTRSCRARGRLAFVSRLVRTRGGSSGPSFARVWSWSRSARRLAWRPRPAPGISPAASFSASHRSTRWRSRAPPQCSARWQSSPASCRPAGPRGSTPSWPYDRSDDGGGLRRRCDWAASGSEGGSSSADSGVTTSDDSTTSKTPTGGACSSR